MRVTIDTTQVFGCCIPGCRSTQSTYRHHKGCDNFIGKYNAVVALEYDLYKDCCRVCDKHHMWIHYAYGFIIREWTDLTPNGALRLRTKLIQLCDRIIAGQAKMRKPNKSFVREWRRRRSAWKQAQKIRRSQG